MSRTFHVIHRRGIDDVVRILNHANSPACPKRMLEINPAFGCAFQCRYCGIYALEKAYYDEVIVYDDYPDYLDEWLTAHPKEADEYYFYFSAKTDCLQPALVESGITLRILQILQRHGSRYFIVTKGGVPPRPISDALIAARALNQVIVSVTMPDEALRLQLEPGAAPIEDRLEFARSCVDHDIAVTASCCPILPIDDFTYLRDVFAQLDAIGVHHFYFDFARLSREAVENMIALLPEHRESLERHYDASEARTSRWELTHRGRTIDKYQPPVDYMLEAFQKLSDCVAEVAPGATVSVCNHFTTPSTLPEYNRRARGECLSCMGQRFDF